MVVVRAKEIKKEKQPTTKELLKEMRDANKNLFVEIADFVALLQEFGVTSYKLTGSIQEPVITNYSVS